MSERMSAQIKIGGAIRASLVPQLCEAIKAEQVSLEWGDAAFEPDTGENLLDARRAGDGMLLVFYDEQACWGEFAGLEQFLRENDIAFDRLTDGRWEFPPCVVYNRPGNELVDLLTDDDHVPVVRSREFEPVVALLGKVLSLLETEAIDKAKRAVKKAMRLLAKAMPPEISPLEPFDISEE